jgi:hypothetical protein
MAAKLIKRMNWYLFTILALIVMLQDALSR